METPEDADVLRVLELHLSGVSNKMIQLETRLDSFTVQRIVGGKKARRTKRVIEKYPEWRAKHQHLLEKLNSDASNKDADGTVGEYEAKRLQRLRENQAAMAALGMHKLHTKRKYNVENSTIALEREAARKNPRRSSRLSAAANLSLNEAEIWEASSQALTLFKKTRQERRFRKTTAAGQYQELDLPIVDLSALAPVAAPKRSPPPPVRKLRESSMQLDIDLESFHARWLGNQIWPKGKQTIMQGMCLNHIPLFSKMSGVQPWKNAVALFVNVQGESQYDNVFHQVAAKVKSDPNADDASEQEQQNVEVDGKNAPVYFQWFAQQRQHLASPVIMRLLNAQKGDEELRIDDASYYQSSNTSTPSSREPVLLFLRHVDGPYIYCGRLGLLGFRSNSLPLEFRWQLLDIQALEWSKIKTLIESSSEQVDGAAVVEEEIDFVG